jgi:hypothetical protein
MPDNCDSHRFNFDLDRGIRSQVVDKLESSASYPLSRGVGPNDSGIYALYYRNKLVYVGKASKGMTKSKRSLRARLSERAAKIEGRRNTNVAEIKVHGLTFESEWRFFAAEFALMAYCRSEWNEIWSNAAA